MSGFSVFTNFKAKDEVSPTFSKMASGANSFGTKIKTSFNGIKSSISGILDKIFTIKNAIVGLAAGAALTAIKTFGQKWIDAASDLTETQGKIDAVFGGSATVLNKWAKTSIQTMGLAGQTALDSAALFGDMGTGMGLPIKKSAEMAMSLTQLSADLASFKNISNDVAKTALNAVYTGETESLKKLGVVMTEANLIEHARRIGITKKLKDLKQTEKVELRYQYVMAMTKNAQGDFARTSMNAANQMRMYKEAVKEIETRFGNTLLPYYTKAITALNKTLVDNMPAIQKTFEGIIGSVGTFYKSIKEAINFVKGYATPILTVFSGVVASLVTYKTIQMFQMLQVQMALCAMQGGIMQSTLLPAFSKIKTAILGAVKAAWAFATTPVGLVIIAIGLLVGAIVYAYQKFEGFRVIVQASLDIFKLLGTIITIAFKTSIEWVTSIVSWFQQWLNQLMAGNQWLNNILTPIIQIGQFIFNWLTPIGLVINGVKALYGWISAALEKFGGFRGIGAAISNWANSKNNELKVEHGLPSATDVGGNDPNSFKPRNDKSQIDVNINNNTPYPANTKTSRVSPNHNMKVAGAY